MDKWMPDVQFWVFRPEKEFEWGMPKKGLWFRRAEDSFMLCSVKKKKIPFMKKVSCYCLIVLPPHQTNAAITKLWQISREGAKADATKIAVMASKSLL